MYGVCFGFLLMMCIHVGHECEIRMFVTSNVTFSNFAINSIVSTAKYYITICFTQWTHPSTLAFTMKLKPVDQTVVLVSDIDCQSVISFVKRYVSKTHV